MQVLRHFTPCSHNFLVLAGTEVIPTVDIETHICQKLQINFKWHAAIELRLGFICHLDPMEKSAGSLI